RTLATSLLDRSADSATASVSSALFMLAPVAVGGGQKGAGRVNHTDVIWPVGPSEAVLPPSGQAFPASGHHQPYPATTAGMPRGGP
ncbi:hypothetical protein B7486_66140, partial [cyanobacterium TDX16]